MKSINIHDAKTHLSQIVKEIAGGETYIICKKGEPVAQITAYVPEKRTEPHSVLSQITINYDPTEALQNDEWGDID